MRERSTNVARRRCALLVVTAAILMGLPTLRGGFVGGDDHRLALDHVFVNHPSWAHAVALFQIVHRDLYQPLPLLSFQFEFVVADLLGLKSGGPDAFGWLFHLNNILLHAINSLLVFLLVRAGCKSAEPSSTADVTRTPRGLSARPAAPSRELVPTVAGVLFAVHPFQTEVVAWLNGRMMLLSTFFLLLGLLAQVRWMGLSLSGTTSAAQRVRAGALVALCMLGCNISKVRVELPVLMLILAWAQRFPVGRRFATLWVPCALLTGFFAWLNIHATAAADLFAGGEEHLRGPRLVRVALALAFYFQHFVWPTGLASYYPTPSVVAWSDPTSIRAILIVAIGLSVMIYASLVFRPGRLGALWFFAAIAATLPLFPARNILAADRYMYVPIIGLLWPTAEAMVHVYRSVEHAARSRSIRRAAVFLSTSIAVVLIGVCWYTAWFYEDPIKKTYRVAMLYPDEPRAWERVGWTYYDVGDYPKAVEMAERELGHSNSAGESGALQLLGMVALKQGRVEEALRWLHRALELDSKGSLAHVRLAMAYDELDRPADALPHLEAAVRESPLSNPTWHRLASAYRRLGRSEDARACYERELSTNAYEWSATIGLVELDLESATPDSLRAAERRLNDLLAWMPDNVPAHINLGVVCQAMGRTDDAMQAYRRALVLDARNATAALNLAQLLAARGDARAAATYFNLAAESGPNTVAEAASLVDALIARDDLERAVGVAEGFHVRFPRLEDATVLEAWVRMLKGDKLAAHRACATNLSPSLPGEESAGTGRDSKDPRGDAAPMRRATCTYLAFLERRFPEAGAGVRAMDGANNTWIEARRRLLAALERFDRTNPDEPWTFCLAAELLIANQQVDAARASLGLCEQRCRDAGCLEFSTRLRSRIPSP